MDKGREADIALGGWDRLGADAARVRHQVFVLEQAVPPKLELDGEDAACLHAVAYGAGGRPVGTGRLLPDGHIGRMAVLPGSRGLGTGGRILRALVEAGRRAGHARLVLHAQIRAGGFYRAHGFVAEGEPFMEAGIEHCLMALDCTRPLVWESPGGNGEGRTTWPE